MKKRVFSVLYLTINFYYCIGQIINNNPTPVKIGAINFNPEVIRQNKIKKIEIKVTNKPDGALIVDRGTTYEYTFNPKGYVTRYYHTVFNRLEVIEPPPTQTCTLSSKNPKETPLKDIFKYINDTVFINVMYDNLNRIICKRIKNDTVYDGYYYNYNNSNQIIKEVHYKETNTNNTLDSFKLGIRALVFSETFEYKILSPNETKKISLNSHSFPYKNTFIKYDNNKNIINETNESTVSSVRQEYHYVYTPANKLIKKSYESNENGNLLLESVYEYAKNGNLTSERIYKNNELIYELNFIYDENDIIKSEANRNHKSSTIFIAKYSYDCY